MHSTSSTTTACVSWSHTQPFARPTRFRPLQNLIAWRSKIGPAVASSSTTTTARPPKFRGRLFASFPRKIQRNDFRGAHAPRVLVVVSSPKRTFFRLESHRPLSLTIRSLGGGCSAEKLWGAPGYFKLASDSGKSFLFKQVAG